MHEAQMHEASCLLSLTYADEHLPPESLSIRKDRKGGGYKLVRYDGPTLHRPDFQNFMKRLRKRFVWQFPDHRPAQLGCVKGIRYFHCGEYGETFGRPHYHALLFGFDFPDKHFLGMRDEYPVFRSAILEELWPYGRSEIGTVTFASAAYVARYISKKQAFRLGNVAPEYATMSLKPGIGANWFSTFGMEVYPSDRVAIRGQEMKPPRYYDKLYEGKDGFLMEAMRAKRLEERSDELQTPQMRDAYGEILHQRLSNFRREFK